MTVAVLLLAACNRDADPSGPDTLPERLSDSAFWALTTESSEPGGYFRSENFLSNERTFQYVIPALASPARIGRAYLGVGPEQNFTYIVALKPKIAFIVDIRRQALQQHLLYKAVAELSPTRAEFLSRLFSRQLAPLDTSATPGELFEEARAARADPALFTKNLAEVLIHLRATHGFTLDSSDMAGIRHVYSTFYDAGPDITYDFPRYAVSVRRGDGVTTYRPRASSTMPNYSELMTATDADGMNRSYLASEANYGVLRDLHMRNLIIPVTGDFAGPKALRAVGAFLKAHNASVAAIYTSNVEQYLFQQDDNWKKYYDNVGQLPLTPATVFIRSMRPVTRGPLLVSMLSPTQRFLDAYKRGRIRVYTDLRDYSNQ